MERTCTIPLGTQVYRSNVVHYRCSAITIPFLCLYKPNNWKLEIIISCAIAHKLAVNYKFSITCVL